MKLPAILLFSSFLFISFATIAQPAPTAEEEAVFTKLMSGINPRHVNWVRTTAAEVKEKNLTEQEIRSRASRQVVQSSSDSQDIEALVGLVMMQCAKDQKEDLKVIMAQVKSLNEQKEKLKSMISRINQQRTMTAIQLDSFKLLQNRTLALQQGRNADTIKFVRSSGRNKQVSKADIDAIKEKLKNDLDSMSEMGEMESLRLQMAMDRMSKMMSTISNLLKKISKTTDDIIQNLK